MVVVVVVAVVILVVVAVVVVIVVIVDVVIVVVGGRLVVCDLVQCSHARLGQALVPAGGLDLRRPPVAFLGSLFFGVLCKAYDTHRFAPCLTR